MNFETYRMMPQSQIYNGHSSGEIAKSAKHMDAQMKCSIFNLSNPISVPAFPHDVQTAYESNGINKGAAM